MREAPTARDTDADWALIGESQPWFGASGNPRHLGLDLDADGLADLRASGEADIRPRQ